MSLVEILKIAFRRYSIYTLLPVVVYTFFICAQSTTISFEDSLFTALAINLPLSVWYLALWFNCRSWAKYGHASFLAFFVGYICYFCVQVFLLLGFSMMHFSSDGSGFGAEVGYWVFFVAAGSVWSIGLAVITYFIVFLASR